MLSNNLKKQIGSSYPDDIKKLYYVRTDITLPEKIEKDTNIHFIGNIYNEQPTDAKESNVNKGTVEIDYDIINIFDNNKVELNIKLILSIYNKIYEFSNKNIIINNYILSNKSLGPYKEAILNNNENMDLKLAHTTNPTRHQFSSGKFIIL